MILIGNRQILKELDLNIYDNLKKYENEENIELSQVEDTRKGNKTLSISKDGKKVYFHSKYDPTREITAIMDSYTNMNEETSIVFYGTGLGYHIKSILEKHPNIKYYIYEPISELLYRFLSHVNLFQTNLMGVSTGIENNIDGLDRFIDLNKSNIEIIELPSHKQNFPEEFKDFNKMFLEIIKNKRSSLATNYSFQKRWIINSMKNFREVLSTSNILLEKKGKFKDKPAILVAAGPSLNEEIENIRYIKENRLAYIFSVGSAINTLIYHDIHPDAATTYDPTERNQIVFKKANENGIKDIPMMFGSSVGYETLENYLGEKYHMITSQDTVANYYLKTEENQNINIVNDAPSIAVVTLQLLSQLGFNPIILVGQNLAYLGKSKHSEGVHYSEELTKEEIEKGIWIKDVYGKEILTNEGFNSMRQQMQMYIKHLPNIKVINTTKGGADIEGIEFIELNEVMENELLEKIVEDNWLSRNKTNYHREYLDFKLRKMDIAYDKALKVNKDYKIILKKIEKGINNRNFSQVENLYIKLDKELKRIENNDFYKTFILPMNRVQYKLLADSIDSLNETRNPYDKGNKIVESFKRFMDICEEDIELIKPIYKDMKQNILKYINNENGDENV